MWDRHYAHLSKTDIRDRIRRDAGIDMHGNRVATAATKDQLKEAFFEMMQEAMSRRI